MTVINFIGWLQCFTILPYSELEMYVFCSNTMKLHIPYSNFSTYKINYLSPGFNSPATDAVYVPYT